MSYDKTRPHPLESHATPSHVRQVKIYCPPCCYCSEISDALRWEDFLQFFDQRLKLLSHGIPHDILIHIHVIMHNLTPHTCDGIPRNFRVPFAELLRHAASSFADHLNEMSER
jgi:hypothetical protein